ncbi:MAG: class I SAM-dependent methyltransferase [Pseudomonadota bacterium]
MSDEIIGLYPWFGTPAGRYLLEWERKRFDEAVADIFGYHGVQLGMPLFDGLAANRMPHRWLVAGPHDLAPATDGLARHPHALVTDFAALPFEANSLDLVLMPHTLELSADPHATLREVERVLLPEGKVVICGMNPASFWGWKQRRARMAQGLGLDWGYLPDDMDAIGYRRLRDWLRLLSFEVESGQFGCWRPAVRSQRWLDRYAWMDRLGDRWWPIFGAAYFVVATKRVPGMRLLQTPWKARAGRTAAAPVSIASREGASAEVRYGRQESSRAEPRPMEEFF